MVFEPAAAPSPEAPVERTPGEPAGERPRIELLVAAAVLAAIPALLVLYFGFNGGGYFTGTVGFACVIVIQLLIVRILLADRPFAGATRELAIVAAPGVAFVAWVLLSGLWSHAPDRTLIEFDRDLFYVLVFLLFGLVPRSSARIPWMVRLLAASIFVIGASALITRLLPHTWPTGVNVANNRLSFPLTYWNSLGLLCGIGVLLFLGLAVSRTEPRAVQALACGAIPILATTLYFTFSRGAILAVAIGAVVYLIAAGSLRILAALVAALPPAAVAIVAAYHANHLSSSHPTTPAAVSQGKHLVPVVLGCALAAALLRVPFFALERWEVRGPSSSGRARFVVPAATAAVILIVAIAAGLPGWISREYHGFVHGAPVNQTADLRTRLTDPSANGRIDHWRAAVHAYDTSKLQGVGAGTYQFEWEKRRPSTTIVVDAHSLYVEVLGELGIVGLALLIAFLLGIGYGIARRIQGPNQLLYAGLLGAFVAWAIEAGFDWQWEMPGVTAWVFAAGGTALAARASDAKGGRGDKIRLPAAVALAVAAVTPALLLFSQSRLQDSASAFDRGDCPVAVRDARSSINALAVRPEPYQIMGYCDLEQGRPTEAIAAFKKAIKEEPRSWEYRYGVALARAAAGLDPQAALRAAYARNPRETLITDAIAAFRTAPRSRWPDISDRLRGDAVSSGTLSVK